MVDASDKVAYFQAITGVDDPDLCTEILQAHGWDLELAISSFTGTNPPDYPATTSSAPTLPDADVNSERFNSSVEENRLGAAAPAGPSLTWKIITLPISVISGSLGLVSGAIGLGIWVAGGVLSYSLGMIGASGRRYDASNQLMPVSAAASEAMNFVSSFEREFGSVPTKPNFVSEGFMDALQRSRNSYKLLFVYLHSPEHPDSPLFCERTLCDGTLAAYINENFVSWGGNIRSSEGFKMSNSLKASRFPFCAVVMSATNQRIALLQQVEGPKTPQEMLTILLRVIEESGQALVAARLEVEERRNTIRLREEQDAAYRAALEADQARERQRREEQERLEKESAEAERKHKEEEEARERAEHEAAEKVAALARLREEKALSLGTEPEKGPNVTQILVRFPSGERKERRFHSDATVQMVYDYVDSLGCGLEIGNYSLVSNFPRVVYGPEKLSLCLKESGLHPQASLFVELDS